MNHFGSGGEVSVSQCNGIGTGNMHGTAFNKLRDHVGGVTR